MRQILTPFLAFHWMAVFALLAMAAAVGRGGGEFAVFEFMGVVDGTLPFGVGSEAAALFSVAFALVAALFLWTLVNAFLGERTQSGDAEQLSRLAFGGAAGALTFMLLYGSVQPVAGLLPAVSINLAAILVSYLAVTVERWVTTMSVAPDAADIRAVARVMAAAAAHGSTLSRISGRPEIGFGRERP